MAIVTRPDDAVLDQHDAQLTAHEQSRIHRLIASFRDLPAVVEQRRTAREANAAWLAISQRYRQEVTASD